MDRAKEKEETQMREWKISKTKFGHCDTAGQNSNIVLYFNYCVCLIVYIGSDRRTLWQIAV